MQNIIKITDNENFIVAGLVVFSKQNLFDCVLSVCVGFILACVCAYVHGFFNFQSQEYEVIRCAGFQVRGI